MPVDGIPKHLVKTLTRAKFEQLADRYIQACVAPVQQALKDAGLCQRSGRSNPCGWINTYTGYSGTRGKAIRETTSKGVNPDEVVALGAAIQGGVLSGDT